MKKCVLSVFLFLFFVVSYGQDSNVKQLVETQKQAGIEFVAHDLIKPGDQLTRNGQSFLEKAQLLDLKSTAVADLFKDRPEAISIELPYLDEGNIRLELIRHEIYAPGFMVRTSASGDEPVAYEKAIHYQGVIAGSRRSLAALTITNEDIIAVLDEERLGNMVLGEMRDGSGQYILYRMADVRELPAFDCGTEELDPIDSPKEHLDNLPINTRNLENCLNVYLECEHDMYLENGSVQATVDYMTGLFNVVATLYDNETITTNISEIFVWDTPDPYPTGPNTSDALYAFRNYRTTYNGDLAHLISRGAPSGGGVAWVDVLCSSYGYAYSYIYNWYNQFPTYSWSVNVVAHEMGHNVASRHTHDCVWNGNNTAIDGCGFQAGYGGCDGPIPEVGGTVMSYCHLLSVGINFNEGFGPQPGDLMRSRVSNASCLTACNSCDLTVSVSGTDVDCQGDATGSATATPGGGTSPFTYSWSNGATTQTTNNLTAGDYTVTVTDNESCEATATVTISEPSAITLEFTVTDESGSGTGDGAIDMTVSGGTPGYTFNWSNGAITEDISGLSAGTYSVTVTDANGCEATGSATVDFTCTLGVSISSTDIDCQGNASGSATANPSDGSSPYTYSWSNGANTQTISSLLAGDYTVTVIDNVGCEASSTVTISEPSAIILDFTVTDESGSGASDGAVDLSVSGGTAGYSYSWSNGATTQDISGLAAGTYSVTVTDANGCSATGSATVNTCAVTVSITSTDVDCAGESTGSASANPNGGTSPFSYNWSNGGTTQTINNLAAGTYSVTVTDGEGCSTSESVSISEPLAITLSAQITNASSPGATDGAIDLTVSGGVSGYSYSWSNGASSQDISGVAAGDYTVTVTDANNCTAIETYTVGQDNNCSNTVTQYPYSESFESGFGLWTQNTDDDFDWTRNSGGTPTNGTGPNGAYDGSWYLYTEGNGNQNSTARLTGPCFDLTQVSDPVFNLAYSMKGNAIGTLSVDISTNGGVSWTNLWSISGNQGGNWYTQSIDLSAYTNESEATIRITGSTGNGNKADMAIDDISVDGTMAPCNSPSLTTSSTDANCFGAADGTASVTATGGTPPYVSYDWSNGMTGASISGLVAGDYTVTVTDSDNCTAIASTTVGEPSEIGLSFSVTNTSGPGVADGAIDLTVSSGVAPLSYNWSNGATTEDISGLAAGDYTVTVTDANGCTASGTATVGEAGACESLPHNASFDDGSNPLNGWVQVATDGFDWTRNSGGTPTNQTGPNSAYDGTHYLFTEANGNGTLTAILESPCINLAGTVSPAIDFAYHMYGSNMGTLTLDISNDDGATWTTLWSQSGNQGNNWLLHNEPLDSYVGQDVIFRFIGNPNNGNPRGDMAIDAVSVTDGGSLPTDGQDNGPDVLKTALALNPNPSTGLFQVRVDQEPAIETEDQLLIFDNLGTLIRSIELDPRIAVQQFDLDLSDLPNGLYAILLQDGDKTVVKKVIIQR